MRRRCDWRLRISLSRLDRTTRGVRSSSGDSSALEDALRAGEPDARARLGKLRQEALLANPLLEFDRLIVLKRKRGQLGSAHEPSVQFVPEARRLRQRDCRAAAPCRSRNAADLVPAAARDVRRGNRAELRRRSAAVHDAQRTDVADSRGPRRRQRAAASLARGAGRGQLRRLLLARRPDRLCLHGRISPVFPVGMERNALVACTSCRTMAAACGNCASTRITICIRPCSPTARSSSAAGNTRASCTSTCGR